MAEKLIFSLPPCRVDEPTFLAVHQFASGPAVDRPVSYVMRQALQMYLAAHGVILPDPDQSTKQCDATQCDARKDA